MALLNTTLFGSTRSRLIFLAILFALQLTFAMLIFEMRQR